MGLKLKECQRLKRLDDLRSSNVEEVEAYFTTLKPLHIKLYVKGNYSLHEAFMMTICKK